MRQARIHKYSKDLKGFSIDSVEKLVTNNKDNILVKVKSSSINPVDLKNLKGESKMLLPYSLPFGFGVDFSGIVEQAPEDSSLQPGDKVIGYTGVVNMRSLSEYIATNENEIAKVDSDISFTELGALPLVALTAYQGLKFGNIKPGSKVLIHGGSGGVGSVAVQIAKKLGAHVITTASKSKFDYVKSIGADECIDYRTQDFADEVKDVDFVFDVVGGKNLEKSFTVVKNGGVVVSSAGVPPGEELKGIGFKVNFLINTVLKFVNKRAEKKAKSLGITYKVLVTHPNKTDMQEIASLIDKGVRTKVGKDYSFDNLSQAIDDVSNQKIKGKAVVLIDK